MSEQQRKGFTHRLVWCWMLALFAIQTPGFSKEVSRVFERRDVSGQTVFTVTLRATEKLPPGMLRLLQRSLRIQRAESGDSATLAFWQEPSAALDPARAEARVELKSADPAVDAGDFIWTWPEAFQISRPGVIELRPEYAGTQVSLRRPGDGVGILQPGLDSGPSRATGSISCQGSPLPFVSVVVGGKQGQARADGTFEIEGPFGGTPGTVFIAYEGAIALSATTQAPLQIFDDFHLTRSDRVDREPTITGDVADFGDVASPSNDCLLWQWGIEALERYLAETNALPPAGGLRVKRWTAVYMSAGAAPHTFYDYIVAPTDLASSGGGKETFFHEFGHSVRHVADGNETHWHWDDFRFIYARKHNGSQVTNKGFVFNEGWGDYWAAVTMKTSVGVHTQAPAGPEFVDFNEDRVAQRLFDLSQAMNPAFMVRVLTANPGSIHTLREFENRYCAMLPAPGNNAFCSGGLPLRPEPPSCPPGYNDDGLTCRLVNIISKPSYGRGAGTVPDNCGPGRQYDAGLCYPLCPAGYRGVGPVCWQICPAGYSDDGASCRRNAVIFGADNSACPWYDKCGLTFARGCSKCPQGFKNDGCTCRRDAHIFFKSTTTRGAGTVPTSCPAGKQYDAGLCYPFCAPGYSGIGPVCWGSCPAGFDDHGATCYRAPNVFSDD